MPSPKELEDMFGNDFYSDYEDANGIVNVRSVWDPTLNCLHCSDRGYYVDGVLLTGCSYCRWSGHTMYQRTAEEWAADGYVKCACIVDPFRPSMLKPDCVNCLGGWVENDAPALPALDAPKVYWPKHLPPPDVAIYVHPEDDGNGGLTAGYWHRWRAADYGEFVAGVWEWYEPWTLYTWLTYHEAETVPVRSFFTPDVPAPVPNNGFGRLTRRKCGL